MSIASRYRQAWRPSSARTSSRKKCGRMRLPMYRPWRSVNMHRTVSISPSSTSFSRSLTLSLPRSMAPPPSQVPRTEPHRSRVQQPRPREGEGRRAARGSPPPHPPALDSQLRLDLLNVRGSVPFSFRMAVFTLGEGEFLLGRQYEAMPSGDGEVEDPEHEVDQRPHDAGPVVLVQVQGHEGNEGDGPGDPGPPLADGASIGTLDVRQPSTEHDERQTLHEVGDDRAEHGHVQQRAHDLPRERAAGLAELVDEDGEPVPDDPPGDQGDVRGLALRRRDRKPLREVAGSRQR